MAGLAHASNGLAIHVSAKGLHKTNGCGALALAERSGVDAGNQHIFAVRRLGQAIADAEFDFGLVRSVVVELIRVYAIPAHKRERGGGAQG